MSVCVTGGFVMYKDARAIRSVSALMRATLEVQCVEIGAVNKRGRGSGEERRGEEGGGERPEG